MATKKRVKKKATWAKKTKAAPQKAIRVTKHQTGDLWVYRIHVQMGGYPPGKFQGVNQNERKALEAAMNAYYLAMISRAEIAAKEARKTPYNPLW